MDDDLQKLRVTAELTYRSIGRFIYEFSQLEYTLRHYLGETLKLEDKFFDAVINYEFRTLCRVFETVVGTRNHEAKQVHDLMAKALQFNDQRNRVAHGLWVPHSDGGALHHVSRQTLQSKMTDQQAKALDSDANAIAQLRADIEKLVWSVGV